MLWVCLQRLTNGKRHWIWSIILFQNRYKSVMSRLIGHNVHWYLSLSHTNFRIHMNVFTKTVHEQIALWSWLSEHDHCWMRQLKQSQNPLQKETPFKAQFQVFPVLLFSLLFLFVGLHLKLHFLCCKSSQFLGLCFLNLFLNSRHINLSFSRSCKILKKYANFKWFFFNN